MNTKKKYLNIPMVENLYNRNYCKELALKIEYRRRDKKVRI